MKKNAIIYLGGVLLIILVISFLVISLKKDEEFDTITKTISGKILTIGNEEVTIQDDDNVIYTFKLSDLALDVGDELVIEYTGLLDKNSKVQEINIVNYRSNPNNKDNENYLNDNGIFSTYYKMANNKLKELSLDEKIGQLFLVRYPDSGAIEDLKKYQFAGFVFFAKDFANKTESEVKNMINTLQKEAKIPLLTAVDEEGGTVVRVSSNPNLAPEKFKSPRDLYNSGGLDAIKEDTISKSKVLNNLGLNLNLAPVVDVATSPEDYMYSRSIGQSTEITSNFAKTVIEASKNTGVSYTLKHFPGYGNNADTHSGGSTDKRSREDITKNDLPPFKSGIESGAEAILVSHNTVTSIDSQNPASLSTDIHNLLRNELNFTGIIVTDDLAMGAVTGIDKATTKAILAGNDLIITTDYNTAIQEVKEAINAGTISEDLINKLAFRVIAWKYYKGLMLEGQK